MKILLINPPYQTITSNMGVGHQVPLGLLMVGGPLIDAGHEVRLLDAECERLSLKAIVKAVTAEPPDVVMTGHAGSSPAHEICMEMLRAIKAACPQIITVYGGVYPTYHAEAILAEEAAVDVIVRGEGEATALALVRALAAQRGEPYEVSGLPADDATLLGVTFRGATGIVAMGNRPPIRDLDSYRVGWELVPNWDRYGCFGLGRAAIVQFSRGCPHRCTYCGQHGFWVKWRYRDPVKLADEIEWLYRTHDIRFFTLADENPTTLQPIWRRFLEEVAARKLPVYFFATIRATDIVRDAELLPLYRAAGLLYVLMGIESTDPAVLQEINKGSTTRHDYLACQLLKQHGIFSILGYIVGFEDERWSDLRHALRQLIQYDGDFLNAMYVTPHSWTPFGRESAERPIVQGDRRKWDYRHQIFGQRHLKPWQLLLGVKWIELCFHLHPRKLRELLTTGDRFRRQQLLWTYRHAGVVWLAELIEFFLAPPRPVPAAAPQRATSTVSQRGVRMAAD